MNSENSTHTQNENIQLWIIEQEREKNRQQTLKDAAHTYKTQANEDKNHCQKCKKTFNEPKMVQYFACPHCLVKIELKEEKSCKHWLGFLGQRGKSTAVPQECVECEKVLDCMLNKLYDSPSAMTEIKKWY